MWNRKCNFNSSLSPLSCVSHHPLLHLMKSYTYVYVCMYIYINSNFSTWDICMMQGLFSPPRAQILLFIYFVPFFYSILLHFFLKFIAQISVFIPFKFHAVSTTPFHATREIKRSKKKKKIIKYTNPQGQGVNTVLPTINLLLPYFLNSPFNWKKKQREKTRCVTFPVCISSFFFFFFSVLHFS